MNEAQIFSTLIYSLLALSVVVFLVLMFITAPYGRHARGGWGPEIPSRVGWILMEAPCVIVFSLAFFSGERWRGAAPLALFALWQLHYFHRAFIFPFRMRGGKSMALLVALMGVAFNCINGYINGRYLTHFGEYSSSWLADPRFLVGAALFVSGFVINFQSDSILLNLRKPGESGYKLPRGGFYRWLSCPNYFGELLEWTGWAIASWSLPGLAFAVWTAANLVPRARANHRWYQEKFPDYPPERRAVVPGLY